MPAPASTSTPAAAPTSAPAPSAQAAPAADPGPYTFTAAPVPTVSGTARVGLTLTATIGQWSPSIDGANGSYWSADGARIDRADYSSTLVLTAAEEGKRITFTVYSTKPGYERLERTSVPTGAVQTGASVVKANAVSILGQALVGNTLYATTGTWSPSPVTFTYQWSVGGKVVAGATSNSYQLAPADAGKRVTVSVTGSYPGATPATRIGVLAGSVAAFGSIAGTVHSSVAPFRPIASGNVTLWPSDTGESTEPLGFADIVDGKYAFGDVIPGLYTLEFYDDATGQSAFLGGGNQYSGSSALTVSSGRQTTKDFTYSGVGSISGTLTLAGPPAASGTTFEVYASSAKGRGYSSVAADGTFSIGNLPAGSYTLSATAFAYPSDIYGTQAYAVGSKSAPARVTVVVGRAVSGISFVMTPAAALSGVITDASTGQPVAGASVQLYSTSTDNGGFFGSVETGSDGTFALRGLREGTYKVFVKAPGDSGLASTWIGGTTSGSARTFTLKDGVSFSGLRAALPAESVLTGVIIAQDTGLPIKSDYILYPLDDPFSAVQARYGATDAQGRLSISGLPAGQYSIQVHPQAGGYPDQVWGQDTPEGTRVITLTSGKITDIRVVALKQF
ncbi:collagen binding domain-containing protein [Subtercola sp. Z020]|uniref:MSCRAMM family protein n=1 Tax=Subtercola sp. Z020 TaxID=2080582 RepID=UPI00130D8DB8|nr:carboxypeptidase regulatory-like domain-containing protein [Subtercola sp. Z020]